MQRGAGIAMLPDYIIDKDAGLVQLLPETEVPSFDTYFCLSRRDEEPGEAARLPRLRHRQGAQLVLLSSASAARALRRIAQLV